MVCGTCWFKSHKIQKFLLSLDYTHLAITFDQALYDNHNVFLTCACKSDFLFKLIYTLGAYHDVALQLDTMTCLLWCNWYLPYKYVCVCVAVCCSVLQLWQCIPWRCILIAYLDTCRNVINIYCRYTKLTATHTQHQKCIQCNTLQHTATNMQRHACHNVIDIYCRYICVCVEVCCSGCSICTLHFKCIPWCCTLFNCIPWHGIITWHHWCLL